MTIPRQERKSLPRRGFTVGLAAICCGLIALPSALRAATTTLIVNDERSGLAIFGFDPVGYFTDAKAALGLPEFELSYAGVVWRFRNPGNRSAFAANPEVYMPRYGGHDAISIGRGASAPGHPSLWLIAGQRLYLFHSEQTRAAFAEDPYRAIEAAERHWPAVSRSLVP
jgi:hypothetical protein